MYTPEERDALRSALLAAARSDRRISGAALTGSAALDREDRWSDIDLAFGVAAPHAVADVLSDWTDRMYREHAALHHMDVVVGAWTYRVFLLPSTLQVDLAFAPASEFGARAPSFRLVFGAAVELSRTTPPSAEHLVGLAWLHALHARSCIARGRLWQAEYMVSGVRDHVLALMCLRHGLPAVQGRGIDQLPPDATAPLRASLVRHLELAELSRAFRVVVELLIAEIRHVDAELASRLEPAIRELAGTA